MLLLQGGGDPGSLLAGSLPVPDFAGIAALSRIRRNGVLRVGVVGDAPGFSRFDSRTGKFKGLDITVARRLTQGLFGGTAFDAERHLQLVHLSLAERVSALTEDRVDIVVSVFSVTPERQEIIDFTSPYFGAPLMLVVREDSNIRDVGDLRKSAVALVESTVEADLVHREQLTSQVRNFETNDATVDAVCQGEADAVIMCKTLFDGFDIDVRKQLRRLPVAIEHHSFAVGVDKHNAELRMFLDAELHEMIDSGFLAVADALRRRSLEV